MKVKAKLEKFLRLNSTAIPCDVATRKSLKKGDIVDIDDATAKTLIAMNIVEAQTKTKSKSKGDK